MGNSAAERAFKKARLKKQQQGDVAELFERALALHGSGLLPDAAAVYRQLLSLAPNHFNALYLLGRLEYAALKYPEAEALLTRAAAVDPRSADAHMHRGFALDGMRRFEEARASFMQALALKPDDPLPLNSLANVCRSLGQPQEAIENYDRAIALNSNIPEFHYNRGLTLADLMRYEEALASFDRALALDPRNPATLNDRGNALCGLARLDEALASFDQAVALDPNFAEGHNGRAVVLGRLRDYAAAVSAIERALAIKPNYADALTNRASALLQLGRVGEALADLDRALALAPGLASAWALRAQALLDMNRVFDAIDNCERALGAPENASTPHAAVLLGRCLARLGQIDDAIASFDAALQLKPGFELAIANKIFSLDFSGAAGFESLSDVRRHWWEQVGGKITALPPPRNDRDPERRLVLGYVSGDFRQHSASLAFKPVLRRHDKAAFEIVCYSCSTHVDHATEEFRQIADRWRDASHWSDERLAEQIRQDGVDILVDLSGHTDGNRLTVFAGKPAPIQVHAWGNIIPPGLPTIDYVLADPIAIPPEARHLFCETIYDLPCMITLEALPPDVPHAETPALANGFVTFGVFNRIDKISDAAAAIWSQILTRVPDAKLLIKHSSLEDPVVRGNLLARFARHDAPAERIELMGSSSRENHLAALNRVDISLDPFPQNGGVSTWESLQMGVPVVAKLGNAPASRAGAAMLTALRLPDWVAGSDEAYVDLAVARAAQIPALAELRRALPARIAATEAGDPDRYAAAVGEAYRAMWRTYCAKA